MTRIEVEDGPDRGMAWHFGEPFAEQRMMESGFGVVRLSNREVFTITGDERLKWLHTLASQDLESLPAGEGRDVLVLEANGHITRAFCLVDDGTTAWCWTEPGAREELLGWLASMKFWTAVDLVAREDLQVYWLGSQIAVPGAVLALRSSGVADGAEVVLPAGYEFGGVDEAGLWAHEALRIDAGIPRIGLDTDGKAIPNEIGLFGTALDKGCYPGQETVARIQTLGRPPRRLVRLLFDGELPDPGSEITLNDRVIGRVGTVAQHHELGPIGLGLVKRSVDTDVDLVADGIAAAQEALVDPEVGEHFRPKL
ncbi:folate-binding protein [Propionimicrobium sp. PCR01-08-3]|uniref:CAF17-like 4Fe-4S cluster assembly/insertion protein YgfZ n=1 Tax=Propionimicrobium sp. PCR01-08-3 TaxID=3052086 RepID=UPI00255CEAEA|nr:folate-binding protein [Propionimicrobium sp. PCR01-08-3]WIY82001.1 folate-binding protein [Propionimicrobium sp. PCR01-08-3]